MTLHDILRIIRFRLVYLTGARKTLNQIEPMDGATRYNTTLNRIEEYDELFRRWVRVPKRFLIP